MNVPPALGRKTSRCGAIDPLQSVAVICASKVWPRRPVLRYGDGSGAPSGPLAALGESPSELSREDAGVLAMATGDGAPN
jgi:hypothetical protein